MRKFTFEFLKEKFTLYYITDSEEAKRAVTLLQDSPQKTFGLDLETAKAPNFVNYENPIRRGKPVGPRPGLDPLMSEIRLFQLFDQSSKRVYVFDAFAVGFRFLMPLFDNPEKQFIAHNGIFEIKQLTRNGFKNLNIHCSMLLSILEERSRISPFRGDEEDFLDQFEDWEGESPGAEYLKSKGFSLDSMMVKLFDIRMDKAFQTSNWNAKKLSSDQILYAGFDAIATYRIGKELFPKVKKLGMNRVYRMLKDAQHAIAEMELNGFPINKKVHQHIRDKWDVTRAEVKKKCDRYFEGINLNSSVQMGKWLQVHFKDSPKILARWPQSPSSTKEKIRYSFNAGKIGIYSSDKKIAAYLAFKKIDKLITTYGETLALQRHPLTKCVHTSFSLGETRTGRLSSYNPNLQNIPRVKKKDEGLSLRHAFIAPKGYSFVVGDLSQIEMRLAGELSRDKTMLHAFENGLDLHRLIVSKLLGKKLSAVTDEERQMGKPVNFGFLFGMGWKKLRLYAKISYGVDLTDAQAQEAYNLFHYDLYIGYSRWCKFQREKAIKLGFVRTPMGKMRKLLEGEVFTKAINQPIQGGASDVNLSGLNRLKAAKKPFPQIKLCNSIHDETILLTPDELVQTAEKLLKESMIQGMLDVLPNACTKDLIEIHSGKNWHDAKTGKTTNIRELLCA